MKIHTALFTAVLLSGCARQPSDAENKNTPSAKDMQMSGAELSGSENQMATEAPTSGTTAMATGTVRAVDAAAGKISIAHGPIAALNWPAMTMAFKATPEQMASVKVGQKVQFEVVSKGMEATVTGISPMQ